MHCKFSLTDTDLRYIETIDLLNKDCTPLVLKSYFTVCLKKIIKYNVYFQHHWHRAMCFRSCFFSMWQSLLLFYSPSFFALHCLGCHFIFKYSSTNNCISRRSRWKKRSISSKKITLIWNGSKTRWSLEVRGRNSKHAKDVGLII